MSSANSKRNNLKRRQQDLNLQALAGSGFRFEIRDRRTTRLCDAGIIRENNQSRF